MLGRAHLACSRARRRDRSQSRHVQHHPQQLRDNLSYSHGREWQYQPHPLKIRPLGIGFTWWSPEIKSWFLINAGFIYLLYLLTLCKSWNPLTCVGSFLSKLDWTSQHGPFCFQWDVGCSGVSSGRWVSSKTFRLGRFIWPHKVQRAPSPCQEHSFHIVSEYTTCLCLPCWSG